MEKSPKIAFYPCCAADILEPLRILQSLVEECVFCDVSASFVAEWALAKAKTENTGLPSPRFAIDRAENVVRDLKRIDVLFYRRDSSGEGGSGLKVLSESFLKLVLESMPNSGGLIITDGSNSWHSYFGKMNRRNGLTTSGWLLKSSPTQPFEDLGLRQIQAIPLQ